MSLKVHTDVARFKKILKEKVKNNLDKYISSEKIIGQQGGKIVSIPIQRIDLPRFSFGSKEGGAGEGEGDPGDGIGDPQKGSGKGKAGQDAGEHVYEAEFATDELAQMLGEHLELPNIENKGKGTINSLKGKYTGITTNGPEGLRHFKRTFKEALKRNIASGNYDPDKPTFIPIKADKRYRSPILKEEPETNTVVIYMMDVSGSMGDEQKSIVKSEVFWIDLWLKLQYKNIISRFIVHDTVAHEVDREQFFTISESGGTEISSAYEYCSHMMKEDHPFSDWNVYPFHFTDGDNYSSDIDKSIKILKDEIIPNSNVFSYGQVSNDMGFIEYLMNSFSGEEKVTLSKIHSKSEILQSIKTFLGKGK